MTSTPLLRTVDRDAQLLAQIADYAAELGSRPGRNDLMKRFGWGAAKASRLLKLYDQTNSTPLPATPADQTTDASDNPTADQSEVADTGPDQTGIADGPTTRGPDQPDRYDTPTEVPGIEPVDQTTGSDNPSGGRIDIPPQSAPDTVPPVTEQTTPADGPATAGPDQKSAIVALWPLRFAVLLVAGSAFVAIWGGWVRLGEMTGFGEVNLLPGFGDGLTLNLAITLPLGIEAYAAIALYVWVGNIARTRRTKGFAAVSAIASLIVGFFGQAVYHVLAVAGHHTAPWPIVTFVACLPVVVLGMSAALLHMVTADHHD